MKLTLNKLAFRLGSGAYDQLTKQDLWRHQILKLLNHVPQLTEPQMLLDLGCGPGVSAFTLSSQLPSGSHVTGVDISPEMLRIAQKYHRSQFSHIKNIDFIQADATKLPFPDNSFNLITGHSFLYLVDDPMGVLKEARRVLKKSGILVFMEPRRQGSLWQAGWKARNKLSVAFRQPIGTIRFCASMCSWKAFSKIKGRMTPEHITELFTQAGFKKIKSFQTIGGLGLHCVAGPDN